MDKELMDRLRREAGLTRSHLTRIPNDEVYQESLAKFAALVAEACAQTAETTEHGGFGPVSYLGGLTDGAKNAAHAIRAKFPPVEVV